MDPTLPSRLIPGIGNPTTRLHSDPDDVIPAPNPLFPSGEWDLEALLSPYDNEDEMRRAIMQKEEDLFVLNAISNPWENFDEVLVLGRSR